MSEYKEGFDAGMDYYKHHQGGREKMLIDLLDKSNEEIIRLRKIIDDLTNPDEGRC